MPILGFLLLAAVWARFSLEDGKRALAQAGWGLLPLSLLAILWAPWDALTMGMLVNPPRRWRRLLLLEWSSDGLSRLIPSAGLGGEPFRYRHLRPMTQEPVKVVLIYRIFHAITGIMATGTTAALCFYFGHSLHYPWVKLALFSSLAVALAFVALLRWNPRPVPILLSALWPKMVSRFLQVGEVTFILILLGIKPSPERVLLLQTYLAASATLGFIVPGGLGVQEEALVEAATDLGLGAEVGFQIGLLRRCRQLMWAGWGMLAASWLEATAVLKRDLESTGQNAPVDRPGDRQSSE